MDGVVIREAIPADKDAVLNIAEVYDGTDYLKDYFDDMISSEHTTPYVAIYKGEIVGFTAATLVDDGETVISTAARVKPQYSGRGVYKKLTQHLVRSSMARVHAFFMFSTSPAISSSSFKKKYKLKLSMLWSRYTFIQDDARLGAEDPPSLPTLEKIAPGLLGKYFLCRKTKEYLFPGNRMVTTSGPVKLLPSNVPIIWMREDLLSLSDVHLNEENVIEGLLTVSTTYKGPSGLFVCRVHIFGAHLASVRAHVIAHFKSTLKRLKGEAAVIVVGDPRLDASALQASIEDLGLRKVKDSDVLYQLFETDINK